MRAIVIGVLGSVIWACGPTAGVHLVKGVAQKGPFANGTQVTVAELDQQLVPTGRTFNTTIVDDSGAFQLPNVSLESPWVRLSADGFYFDEVGDALSTSRIVLDALADVQVSSSVNANVLTHLERPRVEYLLGQGQSFGEAKKQAQREVLAAFGISLASAADSERLDIVGSRDDDGALLAVSVIVQGFRTPAEVTELLSNLASDLRVDGHLDSVEVGTKLISAAAQVDLAAVRRNLEARYAHSPVANFEQHVHAFATSGVFPVKSYIEYPVGGATGPNLLADSTTSMGEGSLRATLVHGTSLRVVLTQAEGSGYWWYGLGQTDCWNVTAFDYGQNTQQFSIERSSTDRTCDMQLGLSAGAVRVQYYENGTTVPTRTRIVRGTDGGYDGGVYDGGSGYDGGDSDGGVDDGGSDSDGGDYDGGDYDGGVSDGGSDWYDGGSDWFDAG